MPTKKSTPAKPAIEGKKAKEIALEAAIRTQPSAHMTVSYDLTGRETSIPVPYDVVAAAEKIYQWLIK